MTKAFRRPSVRVVLLWLLAAVLVGAFAACTRSAGAGIPTASEGPEAAPAGANSAQGETPRASDDPEDMALAYSQCIRENGVPEFPDPDSQGRILIPLGSGIGPDSPEFQKATDACRHLAPPGWGDTEAAPGDAEVMLEFARCMRENGVPDFPDPDPSAGTRITFGSVDPREPTAQAALEACKEILQDLQNGPVIGG